jgi:hypothetical protein
MPKRKIQTVTKFVVEITASAPFLVLLAKGDIEERLRSPELKLYGAGSYNSFVEKIEVKSYNHLHKRKLLQPAVYGEREGE